MKKKTRNRMGIYLITFLFVCLLLYLLIIGGSLISDANAITTYQHQTHWAFTDEPIEVAWDADASVTQYKYRFYSVERKMYFIQGSTPNNEVQVYIPKTGHFIFEVRACTDQEFAELEQVNSLWCTEYSKTDMPDRVQDQKTFWIYMQRPAPTGVGFE